MNSTRVNQTRLELFCRRAHHSDQNPISEASDRSYIDGVEPFSDFREVRAGVLPVRMAQADLLETIFRPVTDCFGIERDQSSNRTEELLSEPEKGRGDCVRGSETESARNR